MTAKGQFYIIASVFVLISLAVLFVFTLFVNFGTFTLPTQSTDFANLQNAIQQQNNWLQANWYNLNWKTRVVANITGGALAPATITDIGDSSINCTKEIKVFNRSSSGSFLGVSVRVNTSSANGAGPCGVIFNASLGLYEIYYNNSAANESNSFDVPGGATSFSPRVQQIPQNVCSHFAQILPKKNIAFTCSATATSNAYNYSVGFRATDFAYNGSLI
jgi:hypothetical protein